MRSGPAPSPDRPERLIELVEHRLRCLKRSDGSGEPGAPVRDRLDLDDIRHGSSPVSSR